jgi:hypothetical protein
MMVSAEWGVDQMDPVKKQLNLLWPAIAAVLCVIAAGLPKDWLKAIGPLIKPVSQMPYLSFLDSLYKEDGGDPGLLRIALLIAALVLIVTVGLRDYSSFFPHRFKIRVYFDDAGLFKTLAEYNKRELALLNLADNWQPVRDAYLNDLNQRLAEAKEPFRFDRARTYGGGDGVIVGKMEHWGIQKYKIAEGHGNLEFVNDEPRDQRTTLDTGYNLRDTPANSLAVRLIDIYRMKPLIIMPEFNQEIKRTMGSAKEIDHVLCTATKITFMPYVDIGTTIYLFKQEDGRRVPIGYAIYEPSD